MNDNNSIPENTREPAVSAGAPLSLPKNHPSTLRDVLEQAAAENSEAGLVFIADNGSEKEIGLDRLLEDASSVLTGLQAQGVRPGDHLILQLDDKYDFLQLFWACILGGIVPAPIAPTVSLDPAHKTFAKFLKIYQLLDNPVLVLDTIPERLSAVLQKAIGADQPAAVASEIENSIYRPDDLRLNSEGVKLYDADPQDLAFLQFTSGSTGNPKGVMLSHHNLIVNMHSIMQGAGFSGEDRALSWMPLYHDMGLIGGHLAMVLSRTKSWHMRPFTFIKRPLLWLKKIDEHRITATVSPNFGYKWVLEKVKDAPLAKLDLSALRLIFNGAEPISVDVMNRFLERLGALCGLEARAMFPVYGMAEASLAVSFPPHDELPRHFALSRTSLAVGDTVRFVDESSRDAVLMVDEGYPVPGVEIRILDDDDQLLDEEQVGNIQIRGGNVTSGYYRNDEANQESFCEGWLRTGDLGFLKKGRLTISGRAKDIIFINGQNFYAHDLEDVVADQPGIDSNGIAVVGYRDEDSGEERVVLFITLAKGHGSSKKDDILKTAKPIIVAAGQEINEIFGFAPNYIAIVNRRDIPKTSSGKLQRYKLLARFHQGDFDSTTLLYLSLLAGPGTLGTDDQQEKEKKKKEGTVGVAGKGLPSSSECEDMLRDLWADSLGIPAHRIERFHSFAELGGTSIKAIEIIGRLEEHLSCAIPQHIFARANTIASIVEYIHEHQNELSCVSCTAAASRKDGQVLQDIAIIGMSCRFPGAENVDKFWWDLSGGVDSITEVPPDRWDIRKHYSRGGSEKNRSCSKWGGFLDNIRLFDAEFFKIPPEEADHLDPQQRLFLEVAWETMACSGYHDVKQNRTGVFVGASFIGYTEEFIRGGGRITIRPSTATGNLLNMIAARVSHFFDLKGPALTVDTACSSSLAAVHLACQSLRTGECDMALAGGISLNLNETPYIFFSEAGALSPDGVCRVFDEEANGFVPGEGVGAVLLKPYEQAREDGDTVLAIIKGSAMNNDGHSMGLMAPNPHSQADVIRQAYVNSGVSPENVSYVEAHGTATQIGDAIEVRSLSQVFSGMERQQCAIGSVKSNIGHLLAASGIAGLIKVVLSLQHRQLVPSIHCRQEKKSIKFEQTPFFVNKLLQPWTSKRGNEPLVAGINSFGFGGTNCHLIVQESPAVIPMADVAAKTGEVPVLITLSAHHQDALEKKIEYLKNFLAGNPGCSLEDVSYTVNARRSHFSQQRWAMVTDSSERGLEQLESFDRSESPATLRSRGLYYATKRGGAPKTVFMFSGQGAQFPGMGKVLYENEPVFREAVDLCKELIVSYFDHDIVELICGQIPQEELNKTAITQPVTFVMDLALAMYWQGLGLKPSAVIGHSVGEYVAAVIAGVLSLEDALKVVVVRGRLMSQLPEGGGMAAVFAAKEEVRDVLKQGFTLDIAAYNGPENIVLSGAVEELERCLDLLRLRGLNSFKLQVSHAFHSSLMDPILEQFSRIIAGISFYAPSIPFVSNLTGEFLSGEKIDRDYWLRQIRQPVQFAAGIQTLCQKGYLDFLEIGAKDQLSVLTSKIAPSEAHIRSSLPNPRKNSDQYGHLLNTLAELYSRGFSPNWHDHYEGKTGAQLIRFPNYPFQRQEYWISADQAVYPFEEMIKWTGTDRFAITRNAKAALLADYSFNSQAIMPAAGQCELLLSCFSRAYGYSANRIRSIAFSGAWSNDKTVDILFEKKGDEKNFRIITGNMRRTSDNKPDIFTSGTLGVVEMNVPDRVDVEAIIARCPRKYEVAALYTEFEGIGLHYGPYFQNLSKVLGGEQEAIAEISLEQSTSADAVCILHPGLLDSVFQAVGCCFSGLHAFLPLAIKDMIIHRRPGLTGSFAHIRCLPRRSEELIDFDIDIIDRVGKVCVEIKGFSVVRPKEKLEQTDLSLFELSWQEEQLSAEDPGGAGGTWLLFDYQAEAGIRIRESLQERGMTVIDPSFASTSFNEFEEQDYQHLLEKLAAKNVDLRGIIHCADCNPLSDKAALSDLHQLSSSVRRLFMVFKALSNSQYRDISFFRISTNAQALHENERVPDPGKTLSTGFLRSMAREMDGVQVRSVDFSAEHSSSVIASLTMAELSGKGPLETAYRAGKRFVNGVRVWEQGNEQLAEISFAKDHVYWIVGGLQGVGAECALHLVKNGVTRLAISGRTALPPADQYDTSLRDGDQELAVRIRFIRRLEEAGCEVLYLSGDVTDSAHVLGQYNQIKQKWAAVHGVIHSALHLEDAPIAQKSWSSFERVLAPGVWGTILLDRLTRQEPLEFFILFSSLAGVVGSCGQGDYNAANCFMDNFVKSGNRNGPGRGRAVQWGQWALRRLVHPAVQDFMSRNKMRTILADEGMQAFDMILAQSTAAGLAFVPHLNDCPAVAADILNSLREGIGERRLVEEDTQICVSDEAGIVESDQSLVSTSGASMEEYLTAIAAGKLELAPEDLNPDMNFLELGADSMMAIGLIRELEEVLDIELYPTLLFEYPTINELTAYLQTQLPEHFDLSLLDDGSVSESIETRVGNTAGVAGAEKTGQEAAHRLPEEGLLAFVTGIAAAKLELGVEELDPDMNFLELGADSMVAMGLIRAVEEALDVELYPTLLFEYPTINEFVGYLQGILPTGTMVSGASPAVLSEQGEGRKEEVHTAPEGEPSSDSAESTVMELFVKQQSWLEEQFRAQRNEMVQLRRIIKEHTNSTQ